jgi:molybdate transport system regulatory protein
MDKKKRKVKQLRVRCWIDVDGERFFGPGRAELLQLIRETGSISKAAKSMGMSYKKAWAMVDGLNSVSKKPYVIAHNGGQKGGGAEVTEDGIKILLAYQKLNDKVSAIVKNHADILELV